MKASLDREQRLYDALKRISCYSPPDNLRRTAERAYGLPYEEALEYAYENVLEEAKRALKGMRRPAELAEKKSKQTEPLAGAYGQDEKT